MTDSHKAEIAQIAGVLEATSIEANTWQSAARRLADENRKLRKSSGWVEAMRQQQRTERALLLAVRWQKDDREHMKAFGQHLMGGAVLACAEQLIDALSEGRDDRG